MMRSLSPRSPLKGEGFASLMKAKEGRRNEGRNDNDDDNYQKFENFFLRYQKKVVLLQRNLTAVKFTAVKE